MADCGATGQDALTQARLRDAEAVVGYNQSQVNLFAAIGLLEDAALVDGPEEEAEAEPREEADAESGG